MQVYEFNRYPLYYSSNLQSDTAMKTVVRKSALSFLLLFLGIMVSNAQDWPQWRGVNRDGKVTGFNTPQTWPQQLKEDWKIKTGTGDATPALVDNKIYAFGKEGGDEVLQCIDASTGKQLWQSAGYPSAPTEGPAASHPGPRSSVSVADGKVVTLGVWGDLACFDASTGKLLWRNEDYKGKVPEWNTGMSPLIDGGVCYTHLGGPETGSFVAFNLATGAIKWKVDGEGPAYGSPVLMTVDGSKQIVFQSMTKLISFNLSDGKELWEFPTPTGEGRVTNATSPVVNGNIVYFTGLRMGFSAIEIMKHGDTFMPHKLWTNPDQSTDFNTPILKDGFLYALNSAGRLFCINASNGETAWLDTTPLQRFGSLVDTGKEIVVLSSNSAFVVFTPDGQKFQQVVYIRLDGSDYYAHPILWGNHIILKDTESLTSYTVR